MKLCGAQIDLAEQMEMQEDESSSDEPIREKKRHMTATMFQPEESELSEDIRATCDYRNHFLRLNIILSAKGMCIAF